MFDIFQVYEMKLNSNKCAFRVSLSKFLIFVVNYKGIEANPDKIKAVLGMDTTVNEGYPTFVEENSCAQPIRIQSY